MGFKIQGHISENDLFSGNYHLLCYSQGIEMPILDLLILKTKEKQYFKLDIEIEHGRLTKNCLKALNDFDFDFEICSWSIITIDKKYTFSVLKKALVSSK